MEKTMKEVLNEVLKDKYFQCIEDEFRVIQFQSISLETKLEKAFIHFRNLLSNNFLEIPFSEMDSYRLISEEQFLKLKRKYDSDSGSLLSVPCTGGTNYR